MGRYAELIERIETRLNALTDAVKDLPEASSTVTSVVTETVYLIEDIFTLLQEDRGYEWGNLDEADDEVWDEDDGED